MYKMCLGMAQFLMVNSTWTKERVDEVLAYEEVGTFAGLLKMMKVIVYVLTLPYCVIGEERASRGRRSSAKGTKIVYPPCETGELTGFPLERTENLIVSVAQFR